MLVSFKNQFNLLKRTLVVETLVVGQKLSKKLKCCKKISHREYHLEKLYY